MTVQVLGISPEVVVLLAFCADMWSCLGWAAIMGGSQLATGIFGSRAQGHASDRAAEIDRQNHLDLMALERERMKYDRTMADKMYGISAGRLALDRELGMGQLQLGRDSLSLQSELGRGQLRLGQDQFGLQRQQFGYQMAETEAEHRRLRPYREYGYRGLVDLDALTAPGVQHTGTSQSLTVPNPRGTDNNMVDWAHTTPPRHSGEDEDPFGVPANS